MKILKFNEEHKYGEEYEKNILKQEKLKKLLYEIWTTKIDIKKINITEYFPTDEPNYNIKIVVTNLVKKTYENFFDFFDFLDKVKGVLFF